GVTVNVRFPCPACEAPDRLELPGPADWHCPSCGHAAALAAPDGPPAGCALCGNGELFRQKDFPQWLGLSVLAAACATFFVLQVLYHQWLAWAVLLGSAALDGLLYYGLVGDAVVCYRCGARHRGGPSRSCDP